ncbi:MFS transporter [Brachybacterium endophyticum]|uniref:MFS transporter n=1 Tax=Brachybacterium endophyticum TaxID=2182385 RepID=UPI001401DE1A|nr:MFS transporter [Brachybacterium endophyticum]
MTTTRPAPASARPAGYVPGRWRKLALIGGTLFADNNESSVISTLAPVIFAALALPLSALGVLVAVGKCVTVVFGPFWAFVARRTNRKTTFVLTTAAAGLVTIATGFATGFVTLLLGYAVTAVFVAAALPLVSEITIDLFDAPLRGRASGYTWGAVSLLGSVAGPLLGRLSTIENGWRWGFFLWGAVMIVLALLVFAFFRDPGVGASEPTLVALTPEQRAADEKLTWAKIRQMLRIPTFVIMLIQRLVSGHLLIGSFGTVFLVSTYGFTTAVAAVVTLPFGIGYTVGTLGGGIVTDALHKAFPRRGRLTVLQFAQIAFGIVAIIATQVDWGGIGVFAIFWAMLGFLQGLNPGVNRPIVAAVVPPELRGAAFALMLSVFEAIAYAIFNLLAGYIGQAHGLVVVMLWLPGIVMLANGLFVSVLYWTYPKDADRIEQLLVTRARQAQAGGSVGA